MWILVVDSSHYRPQAFFWPSETTRSQCWIQTSSPQFSRLPPMTYTYPVRDCPILSHMSNMRPQSSAVFISLVAFSAGEKIHAALDRAQCKQLQWLRQDRWRKDGLEEWFARLSKTETDSWPIGLTDDNQALLNINRINKVTVWAKGKALKHEAMMQLSKIASYWWCDWLRCWWLFRQ